MMRAATTLLLYLLHLATNSHAAIHFYGREPVHSSGWSKAVDEIVNDPSRVSGMIGPVAPSARFQYAGGADVVNRILKRYATLAQQSRLVYLHAGPVPSDDHDFEVSITHDGYCFVHLYSGGRIKLHDVTVPPGVSLAAMPLVSEPLEHIEKDRVAQDHKRIQQFIAHHTATRVSQSRLAVGMEAPSIAALTMDGNAINAFDPWPKELSGHTVLIAFWATTNSQSARHVEQLQPLRKEFAKRKFKLLSVCINNDWGSWLAFIQEQGPVNYGDGPVSFGSDSVWWQVIQNANGPSALTAYYIQSLPAFVLVGPDRRVLNSHIPADQLRHVVTAALRDQPPQTDRD